MGRGNRDHVKVVIINTQYVETDAVSFKSVVQSLTGKNSTAAAVAAGVQEHERLRTRNEVLGYGNGPVLNRKMSFKDFDRILKELPPLDELYRLYPDH
ncbi:hypothetical protein OROGR_000120 [Orobanche gracilis]